MSWMLKDIGLSDEALEMVAEHDLTQREMWGKQSHSAYKWLAIAMEEAGEVANAVLEKDLESLEREATHAATVFLKMAWMARKKRKVPSLSMRIALEREKASQEYFESLEKES